MKLKTYLEELTSVLISIVYTDGSTAETNIKSDSEISGLEWHVTSVLLKDHLPLEEGTLHSTSIDNLGFSYQN